jgi:hypothetical protein
MVRRGRRFRLLVALLAALPLALAACGGSDSKDQGAQSTTDTVASGTGGATGATGASGAKGTRAGGTTGSSGKKSSGSGGSGGSTSGGSTANSGGTIEANKKKVQSILKKRKKPKFLPGSFIGQRSQLFAQSKQVCKALTLDGLAHEYNVSPKTPAAVAQRYAKAYPPSIRKAVYRGCKAGLS